MANVAGNDILNIAVVGHGAVGKTSLLDAALHYSKANDRRGSVDDGTSFLDVDDEEKARKFSIDAHCCWCVFHGKRFQFIDTPGYPDFLGPALAALANVETALVMVDARRGVEPNTRKLFEQAGQLGCARFVAMNKLDLDGIDYADRLRQLRNDLGRECFPIDVPLGRGAKFRGALWLEDELGDIPADAVLPAAELRAELIERVVETDDALLEKFLAGTPPTVAELRAGLAAAVASGRIVPVLGVSAQEEIGILELFETLADLAPPASAWKAGSALSADPAAPPLVRCMKTQADKFGNLAYLRVYRGTLHAGTTLKVGRTGVAVRLGSLHRPQGRQHEKIESAGPGDVVCVPKLDGVEIGDVLSPEGDAALDGPRFPAPMFPLAVSGKTPAEDPKVALALKKLAHEDPCLALARNDETGETLLRGLSQLHLDVVRKRLFQREKLDLQVHPPRIPYKETVGRAGEGMHRHRKQTGGRGQFAEVHLRLRPRGRGEGFLFTNSVVGGTIPTHFIPAVEKGLREAMKSGPLSGNEVVDIEADVHFGKAHDVDSSEQAFKHAAILAFREAFAQCAPVLLEPVMALEIVAPADRMGDINGDLASRRAHITGMDVAPGGMQVVRAEAPLSELLRYQTELKSMTGGQGMFAMEFCRLAPAPPQVQQRVAADQAPRRTGAEE